ncbi:MAG: hypothetical protein AAB428_03600 [Patescibacteria group bacterium]
MFNQSTAPAHKVISRIPVPGRKVVKFKFNITEAAREKIAAVAFLGWYILVAAGAITAAIGIYAVYAKWPTYGFVSNLCRYFAS